MKPIQTVRQVLVYALSIAAIQSCSKLEETEAKQPVAVDANVENESFALALPAIPDISATASEARLRILKGSVKYSEASLDCSNKPGADQKRSSSLDRDRAALKSLTVAELSLPFKAGQPLGPIKLESGDFSVLLEIFDRNSLAYFGTALFSVAPGVVTKLDLALQQSQACPKPSGSVVINTVLNNNRPALASGILQIDTESNFSIVRNAESPFIRLKLVVRNYGSQPVKTVASVNCMDPQVIKEVIPFSLGVLERTSIVRDIKIVADMKVNPTIDRLYCKLTPEKVEDKNQVMSETVKIIRR